MVRALYTQVYEQERSNLTRSVGLHVYYARIDFSHLKTRPTIIIIIIIIIIRTIGRKNNDIMIEAVTSLVEFALGWTVVVQW